MRCYFLYLFLVLTQERLYFATHFLEKVMADVICRHGNSSRGCALCAAEQGIKPYELIGPGSCNPLPTKQDMEAWKQSLEKAMNKKYANRNIVEQGEEYTKHVSAMTAEGLHDKSDIAAELAHRDIELNKARNIGARLAGVLWDFYRMCPECGDMNGSHMNTCLRTYETHFRGPQDSQRVFDKAFGFDSQKDHDFQCISPGEYDFLYECTQCGLRYTESIDNPDSQRPTTPCPRTN